MNPAILAVLHADARQLVEQLGETVTYYPGGALAEGKELLAGVERGMVDGLAVAGEIPVVAWRLWVCRAGAHGVETVREGKDLVDVPDAAGKVRRCLVTRALYEDPGIRQLEIRRGQVVEEGP